MKRPRWGSYSIALMLSADPAGSKTLDRPPVRESSDAAGAAARQAFPSVHSGR
ncbi:hypothetical protein [Catelliglobosispora koreensis]|uniref:hypothetical protein n=1 Tax=Catelliglobosispora koreensis TaxID=129052 RepID=UPI0012FC73B3|nr:hypothetical protein [Catelliglobosispora koreensis]